MEFKTLSGTLDQSSNFDERLNVLVADGWKLVRREVLPLNDSYALYAELYKPSEADLAADLAELREAEPITWEEAVWVLRETCQEAKECGPACPAYAWCQKNIPGNNCPPCGWGSPEELDPAE